MMNLAPPRKSTGRRFPLILLGIVVLSQTRSVQARHHDLASPESTHCGRCAPFAPALVLNPTTNKWWRLSMPSGTIRCQTVVALADGRVLIAGGVNQYGLTVHTTLLYNPRTGRWQRSGNLHVARCDAPGVLLTNGDVLVTGGEARYPHHRAVLLSSAELYDPKRGRWRMVAALPYPIAGQVATLLRNGDVLEVGGISQGSALEYSVKHNRWTAVATEPIAGVGLTATTLNDGRVLVVGTITHAPLNPSRSSALLFDPDRTWWHPAGMPGPVRAWQTATLLRNGMVLIAGGLGAGSGCVLFDPHTNRWRVAAALHIARFAQSATLLADGRVLIAGGLSGDLTRSTVLGSTELYNPSTNTWRLGPSWPVGQERSAQAALLLPGKNVLFVGGTREVGPP
jgi:N-acetylneuraminic acid mutarotase